MQYKQPEQERDSLPKMLLRLLTASFMFGVYVCMWFGILIMIISPFLILVKIVDAISNPIPFHEQF